MAAVPDCLICGACCASPFVGQGYIRLDPDEEARLARKGLPVLEIVPGPEDRLVLLGTKDNAERIHVCVALTGQLGKQVACSIYEQRPLLCRQFEAGSAECYEARRALGISETPSA